MTLLRKYLLLSALLFAGVTAYSQATVVPNPPSHVDACGGLANGSITFTVTAGVAPFNLFYFGIGFGQTGFVGVSQGVPVTVPNLVADTYLVSISDGDVANPNYSTFVTINNNPAVAAVLQSKTDNSNCAAPNGQITITASSGTGAYSFAWTSDNGTGPFPNSNVITGLRGGNYSVVVSDLGSNCTASVTNINIADPSPIVQTVSTTSPEHICLGDPATISLASTQVLTLPGSYYEIVKNGTPTGVKASGTGGPLTLILPGGFVNGDVLTVRAVDGLCTPAPMSGSVTLNVHNPPTAATLSGTATICGGQSTNLSVLITGGTGPFSFTITGIGPIAGYTSGNPIAVSPAITTTYTLSGLVTDANGCTVTGTGSAIVTVNPPPTATIAASPGVICAGQGNSTLTFTLTGTGPTFNVSYNDGTTTFNLTGISTGHTVAVSPATTKTYTITSVVDLGTSCAGTPGSNALVTVNTPPSSAVLSLTGAGTICAGQSTTIRVVITGGTGPYDFTITGLGPQVGYVSGTVINVAPATTTNYSLVGNTVTDALGCTVVGSGSTTVTVNPLPTAVISATPGAICAGSGSSTLTFTLTGTGPFNVVYSDGFTPFNLNGISSGHTVVVSPAATTTYVITSVTDATGCAGLSGSNATVSVNNPPTNATLSGTAAICPASSTNLSVTIVGGVGPYTITINNGVGTINNYISGTPIPVSPVATTTYNLTAVSDANGCNSLALSGSAIVTVNPAPTSAVLSGTATICAGSGPTNLIVTITSGTGPFTVTIDNGVGTLNNYVSGTAIPVNPAATTTYNIVGLVTDVNGCSVAGTGSATVTINNPPTNATLGGTASICPTGSTDLSVVIVGGVGPYTITINNGVGTINNYTSGSPIPVSPVATTTYNLTAVTDANGCASLALSGSATVTVNPGPTSAVLNGNATICAGSGPTNLSVTVTGGTSPYTVTINNGVGTLNNYVSGTAIPVNPAVTTTYSIVGLVTDANGCGVAGTGSAIVTVNNPPTSATLSGTASICPSGTTNLAVTFVGGTGPYTITIDNGVGTINNYTSGSPIPVSPAANTTYSLTAATDANSCAALTLSGTAVITINTPPSNATLSGTATICAGNSTNLSVVVAGGTAPYSVTIDNGVGTIPGYASGSPIPVSPAATTTYSLTSVTDANGCPATVLAGSAVVTVTPLATATISGSANICVGSSTTITVTLTGTQPWDIVYTDGSTNFTVNGIATSPFTVSVNPIFSTNYTMVSVTDAACGAGNVSGTASVTVIAIPGNPATFGVETWLGYVYDDAGDATPLPARINYSNPKYRGFIDENDMAAMSPFSTYNSATDEFDVNISNDASGFNIHSPNVCGTYNTNFSVRYRMRKTFAQGVYTFTVGSDDGVRLFLDGVSIIPGAFINQAYTTYTSAAQCISAGTHDLVIEYYEASGFARLTFNYQAAAAPTTNSPVSTCVNSSAPVLTASSTDPLVTGFNWYKDAGLTTLLFAGANFTPGPADLDMSTVATTSFFVTAVYACGETVAAQVDVDVISSATITPPTAPAQVCQSAGIIDLTTIVSAIPGGGVFTFSGTGVTTSPNFDPTLVTGTTTIAVSYTAGTCTANLNFNIDVVTTASVTVPGTPVAACQTSAPIDMSTLVSATPSGGVFTFTGPGVTGNMFDPSAQLGVVAITVDYNVGGCLDSKTLNFDVAPTATLTITNTTTCPNGGLVDLTTLVTPSPGGGLLTFSGPSVSGNNFDPLTHAGTTVNINVGYNVGGCTAAGTISITVSASCGSNCGAFTVLITDSRPTCANQNDGIININVSGGSPNYIVTLSDGGSFNQSLPGPGPLFSFTNLSPSVNYTYTILDAIGNTCTLPHSLPVQTSVQAVASNFIDATCFNQPTGGATITVTSGGAAPYEYSTDGGTIWTVFTSPVAITTLMPSIPAGSPYSILVRDGAGDACPAQVLVTIGNAIDILAPITPVDATCANNDGKIQIGTVSGGTGPYTFQLDGVNFATLPPGNEFTGLSGGPHLFTVIDAVSCTKDFNVVINFPGLVNFTTTSVAPDCLGNGTNGSLTVSITSSGSFQVGISTNPGVPPTVFQNVIIPGGTDPVFSNLSKGTYYVTAQAIGAQCPTVSAATISSGPEAVSFVLNPDNIVCFQDFGGVTIQGITGSPTQDYSYELVLLGNVIQSGTITVLQAAGNVSLTGLNQGNYQLRLSQDQFSTNGCVAPITSGFVSFDVVGPVLALDTLYVNRTVSLPDLPSGSMLIGIAESGAEPYEVKLELVQPLLPEQGPYVLDWTAAARNGQNLKMELQVQNLYAGLYTLSVRDSLGCERTYSINLDVDTNIFIPNIFTPNDDDINDLFHIRNLPPQSAVVVTNRWGKEVYRSDNYSNDWGGGDIDDGVYYYTINAAGQTYRGWVEIQRALGN